MPPLIIWNLSNSRGDVRSNCSRADTLQRLNHLQSGSASKRANVETQVRFRTKSLLETGTIIKTAFISYQPLQNGVAGVPKSRIWPKKIYLSDYRCANGLFELDRGHLEIVVGIGLLRCIGAAPSYHFLIPSDLVICVRLGLVFSALGRCARLYCFLMCNVQ